MQIEIMTLDKYPELVNRIRGTIISGCINLELIMDLYIAEKFADTDDKINELSSFIITPRIQWREKLEVLKLLIAKYNADFKTKRPKFYDDIKYIQEHRNVFAHFPAHISQVAVDKYNKDGEVSFIKIKAFTDEQTKEIGYGRVPVYTKSKLEEITAGCNLYIKEIKELLRTTSNNAHLHT